jgi:hypothetical protein
MTPQTQRNEDWYLELQERNEIFNEMLAALELAREALLSICVTHPHFCQVVTIAAVKTAIAHAKGEADA